MNTTKQLETAGVTPEDDLEKLGFKTAANALKADREMHRKLKIAFEFYRVVKPADVEKFNKELFERTKNPLDFTHQVLSFTPVEHYSGVPPQEVLDKVREAKERNCFDNFEVAHIETVQKIPDPIIFGRINGSDLRFAIAQWDDDVKVEDLIGKEEGWTD